MDIHLLADLRKTQSLHENAKVCKTVCFAATWTTDFAPVKSTLASTYEIGSQSRAPQRALFASLPFPPLMVAVVLILRIRGLVPRG